MLVKPKIIVILGQTSTGKSDFAVKIAKLYNGEIVSADSRQVYKNMDLGSGKITKKEMRGVPHHLLSVVSPRKVFTVADFKKQADKKIKEILKIGKVPIICGGTGFYIDAVLNDVVLPEVKANKKLRDELEKEKVEKLYDKLKKLDPIRAENIDKYNKVRLIRALEIIDTLGTVPEIKNQKQNFNVLKIGLFLPDEILKIKIHDRLLSRIKKGMLKEIDNLHNREKISWKRLESFGLEYRFGSQFLQKQITKKEMLEKINTESWHYAKRQKTWFKRDKETIWIDPRDNISKEIEKFLKK